MPDRIRFLCTDEDLYPEVAKPQPATKALPDWYEDLDFGIEGDAEPTVRACMSFLDALTMGWIVPAPFSFTIQFVDEKLRVETETEFPVVHMHTREQLGGEAYPGYPKPIIKFVTPWVVDTPAGTSILVTPPMNRREERFTGFSGVVETDEFPLPINLPSLLETTDEPVEIEKGTPLFQIVPFSREGIVGDGEIGTLDESEKREMSRFQGLVHGQAGVYRERTWEPKNQARVVERE